MHDGPPPAREWISLREVDTSLGLPKGSAFRAFKQLEPRWRAGIDFRLLHHQTDRAAIEVLRSEGRIYRSSVNPVLLSATAAAAVRSALRTAGTPQPT